MKSFFKKLGPGFITGASDDDPSGIATYSQTGAMFGYGQLWTAIFSFPFMTVVQEMCGRIGMVTGKGLAGVIKHNYPRPVLYFAVALLVTANTVNIGANLGAMASSGQLLFKVPFVGLLVLFTLLTLVLVITLPYEKYARVLKYLTFSLFAYIITVFMVKQDWTRVLFSTFLPNITFSQEYLLNIIAILGTTISPYLFFWQASQEVEEEVSEHKLQAMGRGVPEVKGRDIRGMGLDTTLGMLFSNIIMFFIILTTASTLSANGINNIESAAEAAEALRPFAGDLTFWLFAGGIIGTGLLSIPVLAGSASYALSETAGQKAGLGRNFKDAPFFYGVIIISVIAGVLINFLPIPSFKMLYYTAILNGLCAPPLLLLIMLTSNNKSIMGNYINSKFSNFFGWTITGIMSICVVALLWLNL